jgi:hypothetical protein
LPEVYAIAEKEIFKLPALYGNESSLAALYALSFVLSTLKNSTGGDSFWNNELVCTCVITPALKK